MRLAQFYALIEGEFGRSYGDWILSSHVLPFRGISAREAIERGDDLRDVWLDICKEFDVPEQHWLGEDI